MTRTMCSTSTRTSARPHPGDDGGVQLLGGEHPGPSPPPANASTAAATWRSLVSTSRWPPGASQPGAPAATRRRTSRPSSPPSSATRASCTRASAGSSATSPVGTYGTFAASTSTRPRSAPGSGVVQVALIDRCRRRRCGARTVRRRDRRRRRAARTRSAGAASATPTAPVPQHRSRTYRAARPGERDRAADEELRTPAWHEHPEIHGDRRPQNSAQPRTCSRGSPAARRSTMAARSSGVRAAETSRRASSSAKTQPAARSRETTADSGRADTERAFRK